MIKKQFIIMTSIILTICVLLGICNQVMISYASNRVGMFANFSSSSYILMDRDSKTILYGMNAEQKMPVASICKLMTTLITLEHIEKGSLSLDDKLRASSYACSVEGSQAFLDEGSEYVVSELLKSVIVASANDSAIVLAENIAQNENAFVELMNNKAKQLGMDNTLYANATGLEASNQYSTAYDTAILLDKISDYEIYKSDCHIWTDSFTHPSGRVTDLVNTNRLIKYYDYCNTGKTGFTDDAKYCLSSTASKNNLNLIAVVLGCKDSASRFKESIDLYEYGFLNYFNQKVVDQSQEYLVEVNKGKQKNSILKPIKDSYIVNKKGSQDKFDIKYDIPKSIDAPLNQNDVVGQIIVIQNGEIVDSVDVVVVKDIYAQSYNDIVQKIVTNWSM